MSDYSSLRRNSLLSTGADYLEGLYEDVEQGASDLDEATSRQWVEFFEQDGPLDVVQKRRSVPLSSVRQRFVNLRGQTSVGSESASVNPKQSRVTSLINSYRMRGHERSNIDPLNLLEHPNIIELSLQGHGLGEEDLASIFDAGSLLADRPATLQEIYDVLRTLYCGTLGTEYMHIAGTTEKEWVRSRVEAFHHGYGLSTERRQWLLQKINAAESLEKFLHTKYVGQKRFSLEGGESLIACLASLVEMSAESQVDEVIMGMAHRGRLNVLVNIFGKRPKDLFEEFEGRVDESLLAGDVKYHQGFSSDVRLGDHDMHMVLAFNPSHLEIVSPVVEGSVRARQDRLLDRDPSCVLPINIHGDAAFAGQGVVMETLNMSGSRGYSTRGTIHIVVNNQIGFTTSFVKDARSTLYCTDVAKMLNIPIFHVNADDPEAVYAATKIAFEYRQHFRKDVIIDLVCYRRHGHNEADEPAVTQPNMYRVIRALPTTNALYAKRLIEAGVLSAQQATLMQNDYKERLKRNEQVADYVVENTERAKSQVDWRPYINHDHTVDTCVETGVEKGRLQRLATQLATVPEDFSIHSRAQKILLNRREMAEGVRPLDWGMAENLAYGTLLDEGTPIRITGQDVCRGTFFHRHAVYHNTEERKSYTPLAHLSDDQPRFTIIDSLLSEEAVLAFEYGYATSSPDTLVVWEAQFGDFANGAQVVIDQFITSGEAKWGRYCGLVMLLPHGYEGQGPEHSSARPERFMQLCAEENIQLVVPSTPAQIFHLLRRQIHNKLRKPLVVMSPKSLLRHPEAISSLDELANGHFQMVIDDPEVTDAKAIEAVVICSGKVYYELREKQRQEGLKTVALVRLERYYPFPYVELLEVISRYSKAKVVRWCQEEPKNQGAWRSINHRIERVLQKATKGKVHVSYAGRPSSASPAVGSARVHKQQQDLLIAEALGLETSVRPTERWLRQLGKSADISA
jgi:2-oxoglutarate dehydrogenase E1 component